MNDEKNLNTNCQVDCLGSRNCLGDKDRDGYKNYRGATSELSMFDALVNKLRDFSMKNIKPLPALSIDKGGQNLTTNITERPPAPAKLHTGEFKSKVAEIFKGAISQEKNWVDHLFGNNGK